MEWNEFSSYYKEVKTACEDLFGLVMSDDKYIPLFNGHDRGRLFYSHFTVVTGEHVVICYTVYREFEYPYRDSMIIPAHILMNQDTWINYLNTYVDVDEENEE